MQINQPLWIIGLMSGTSADAVDAALLQTDGEVITAHGGGVSVAYEVETAAAIHALMRTRANGQAVAKSELADIARAITLAHIQAVEALLDKSDIAKEQVGLVGFHGQTIYHAPEAGVTEQIGDASLLADKCGISVVADFRSNDVKLGGQGAPLAPLYHQALARTSILKTPLVVLNLGGVANITYIGGCELEEETRTVGPSEPLARSIVKVSRPQRGTNTNILAFDCGPANAMMDDVMRMRLGKNYDENGALAKSGKADAAIVAAYMRNAFFEMPAPKSLDRNQFDLELIENLSDADALATLAAFTVKAVLCGVQQLPQMPKQVLVTGGGRRNAHMMQMLNAALGVPVRAVETVGWDGDLLEAEAFAYLAARSVRGLPLSLPSTTGGRQPASGGVFYPV